MEYSSKVWKTVNNRIGRSIRIISLFVLCYSCNCFCSDIPDRLKRELIKEKHLYDYCKSYHKIIKHRDTAQIDTFLSYSFCDKTVSAIHAEMIINTLCSLGEESFIRSYDRLSLNKRDNLKSIFRCYIEELSFCHDSTTIHLLRKNYPIISEILEL